MKLGIRNKSIIYVLVLLLSLNTTFQILNNKLILVSEHYNTKAPDLSSKNILTKMGNEIQANTYNNSNQAIPAISCISNDSVIIVWQSANQDGSLRGIFAKLFDSDGNNKTNDIQVNTYNSNDQLWPSVSYFSDKSFVITWTSDGQDTDGYGVYAKIFNSSGLNRTNDIQVNSNNTNDQRLSKVSSFSDGSFVVAWESYFQDGDGTGVFFKIFNSTGANKTDDIRVNDYTSNDQDNVFICCLPNNDFVVAWISDQQDGAGDSVYIKIFNSLGVEKTGEILVNNFYEHSQMNPFIRSFSDSSFVIAWQCFAQDGDGWGIFTKIFNSTGLNTTNDIQANTHYEDWQDRPSVCCFSDKSFMVTWNSRDITYTDVYASLFDSSGHKLTGDIRINTYTQYYQDTTSVDCLSNDKFVIVWQSQDQDGDGLGIFFRIGYFAKSYEYEKLIISMLIMQSGTRIDSFLIGGILLGSFASIIFVFWYWNKRR